MTSRNLSEVAKGAKYPLTPSQQRMWIIHRLNQNSTAYNSPVVRKIDGELDPHRVKQAFVELIERHEQLRTAFSLYESDPVQEIQDVSSFDFTYVEEASPDDIQERISRFIRPFPLEQAPLLRACLFRVGTSMSHILVVDMHHIISDLLSEEIIVDDLLRLYQRKTLPELPVQYKTYAKWLQENAAVSQLTFEEEFWLSRFGGELPVLQLPTDFPRPPVFDFCGTIARFPVATALANDVRAFSAANQISLRDIFLGALFVLLNKYSYQEDIVVGVPHETRPWAEMNGLVGLFINTLPMRAHVDPDKTVAQLLAEVSAFSREARQHFLYDVRYLVEKLPLQRDPGRNPLYDVLFFHQKLRTSSYGDLQVAPFDFVHEKAEVDLTFGLLEVDDQLSVSIEYYDRLFEPKTIARMAAHYQRVLEIMVTAPDVRLGDLDLLSETERERLWGAFNDTASAYPSKTIDQLFDEQVLQAPLAPAIRYQDQTISYQELCARADRLAETLQSRDVSPGHVIALLTEPSVEMIVGMLGILKAGCAYLPIEPSLPVERIAYMLKDSRATLLLTQHSLLGIAESLNTRVIELDHAERYPIDGATVPWERDPSALAYVIYTSGSTGNPKGTLIQHHNVVRTVTNTNYLTLRADDKVLQLSSYAFDASVFDVFGALLNGATLIVADKDARRDINRIVALLQREDVSIVLMTTALFNTVVDERLDALDGVRKVLCGGEQVSVSHMRRALARLGPGRLLNMYGPTETTVFATYYPVDDIAENASSIPIGFPLSNTKLYILNGRSSVPLGAAGELCIAGDGVGAGYLDRELTAGKFVPISAVSAARVYRTGDIAKWLDNGAVEFIGRRDRQTKIRGLRIEPEEIEARLQEHPELRAAVVVVSEDPRHGKYLRAFYTAAPGAAPSQQALTSYLSRRLPAYMIPASFVLLEDLPLNASGKLDRKQLSARPMGLAMPETCHPPATETEKQIAAIWEQLLGEAPADIRRNFFECGGHSLSATVLANRIERALQVEMPLREVFQHPTIEGMAACVTAREFAGTGRGTRVPRNEKRTSYSLSFSERMVYAHQHATRMNHSYHSVFPMILEGPLDEDQLEWALKTLIQRHDAFRTAYFLQDGEPVKTVLDEVDFQLICQEGSERDIDAVVSALRAPYDLGTPPLFRASLLKIGHERRLLVIANHHIVSDGITEALFMQEISSLYEGHHLKPPSLQYSDYTIWQQRQWDAGYYQAQERYWLDHLKGTLPVLQLPLDFPRPSLAGFDGHTVTIRAGRELTGQLHALASAHQTTLFVLLFAAYTVLLHKYSAQDDIIVGVPVANRMHPDLEEIVGMFVNMVPWRNYPAPNESFAEYLNEVKASSSSVYQHQDYPFERLVHALRLERDPSRNPVFDTIFVLQSAGQAILNIKGLRIAAHPLAETSAKTDLAVEATESAGEVAFGFTYNTALFATGTIHRMAEHFIRLLSDIASNPGKSLRALEMLSSAETYQLLHRFNPPATSYPKEKSLYQLFEARAKSHPQQIAVRFEDAVLTYEELDRQATYHAGRLLRLGVAPGMPVAILAERSLEMIIAIWAILRAGAIYVPIDPDYPDERIQYILRDSGAKVCLTTRGMCRSLSFAGEVALVEYHAITDLPSIPCLPPVGAPCGPAYILYTSGSTGAPKGVAVLHHNVIRTVVQTNYVELDTDDRVLQLSNYVFDGSVFDIFGALLNGASLVLMRMECILDSRRLAALIRDERITIVLITAALFNACIDSDPAIFNTVRRIFFGGELGSPHHVERAFQHLGAGKLVHGYGPTETTVIATYYEIEDIPGHGPIPIGRPVANTRAYVFNDSNALNPIGVPGELYVAGDGVSPGYWNRPALSRERFLDDPFVPGAVMYKTGDLAKWREDGELVFLGRVDQQVKIRGFRIELGEIEVQLTRHPAVRQCAVVLEEITRTGEKKLRAYYTASEVLSAHALKAHLEKLLPHYMIPDRLIQLSQLPLTANGKIDVKKLASDTDESAVVDEVPASRQADVYVAPCTPLEISVANVWCEVFGLDRVGVHDNFYSLGGHSLKALQIVTLLQRRGYSVSVNDLFSNPTIHALLASTVGRQEVFASPDEPASMVVREPAIEPAICEPAICERAREAQEDFPLSAMQCRFFQRQLADRNVFNSPFLVELKESIETARIQQAMHGVLRAHRILTVQFREHGDGQWRQHYKEPVVEDWFSVADLSAVPLREHDATITERSAVLQGQFSITDGPLFKVLLFIDYLHQGRQVILFLFHHLVFDGISWNVFIEEFRQRCLNPVESIAGKAGASYRAYQGYRDWCLRLERYAREGDFEDARAYWQRVVEIGRPFLPDETPRPYALQREMVHHFIEPLTGVSEVHDLHQAVQFYQASVLTILLAAFCSACRELQPRESLPLYVMSAQRESFFKEIDLEGVIGFFAGAYPIRVDMKHDMGTDRAAVVRDVGDALLRVPKGGLDYFVLRHLTHPTHPTQMAHVKSLDHAWPILFHYQNMCAAPQAADFCTPLRLPVGLTHSPDNPSAYLINITATLEPQGLRVTFYYSHAHFQESTIAALSGAFQRHLRHILRVNERVNEQVNEDQSAAQ